MRFHLDTEGREVSGIVFIFGLYDRPVMEAAFAALAHNGGPADFEGRLFLDMGANIGTATLTAVAHFGAGGGYAIEPDPANFRTLSVNLPPTTSRTASRPSASPSPIAPGGSSSRAPSSTSVTIASGWRKGRAPMSSANPAAR